MMGKDVRKNVLYSAEDMRDLSSLLPSSGDLVLIHILSRRCKGITGCENIACKPPEVKQEVFIIGSRGDCPEPW